MRKILKKEGKRVIFTVFQTLGSPRLASGSPGPPKLLHGEVTSLPGRARLLQNEVKARLGELPSSQMPCFGINRHGKVEGRRP